MGIHGMEERLKVAPGVEIPLSELRISYARSSGPGGQNVNKLNTKARLRFDMNRCGALAPEQKERIASRAGSHLTAGGEIILSCDTRRTARDNREEALERFVELMGRWLHRPKTRRSTKPSASSKRKRVEDKKKRSRKKDMRRRPGGDD